MNEVLAREAQARAAVETCTREASAIVEAAEREARRIAERTDRRLRAVRRRCAQALDAEVNRRIAVQSRERTGVDALRDDDRIDEAVADVAAALTGGENEP